MIQNFLPILWILKKNFNEAEFLKKIIGKKSANLKRQEKKTLEKARTRAATDKEAAGTKFWVAREDK